MTLTEFMVDRYENREDKDNMFGVGVSDAEFRTWNQDPLPLAYEAVDAELTGPCLDTEILYFRTKYYHSFGTPCFHYKNVYFSK